MSRHLGTSGTRLGRLSGRLKLRKVASAAFRYKAFVSPQREVIYNQHLNTHRRFHLHVLDSVTGWSPSGRLVQCQRLKDHGPEVVAGGVEIQGQVSDQEQLLKEEKKGSLLRGRLPMR